MGMVSEDFRKRMIAEGRCPDCGTKVNRRSTVYCMECERVRSPATIAVRYHSRGAVSAKEEFKTRLGYPSRGALSVDEQAEIE